VSTDDAEMRRALADYNDRLADARDRTRRLIGLSLCIGAILSWGVSAFAAGSVLSDPAVAADLDSGSHLRDAMGRGWTAAVCGLIGVVLLLAAIWRGPSLIRWVSVLLVLLGAVPVLWLAGFAFLLSQ
jgi:hypothetical protein